MRKTVAGENFSPESRRIFLSELYNKIRGVPVEVSENGEKRYLNGVYQGLSSILGLKDRRNVHNWVSCGFSRVHKKELIRLAKEYGVEPHDELFTKRHPQNVPKETTPLSRFLHDLALKCGGFEILSEMTGIPQSGLSFMRMKKKGYLRRSYVDALERASTQLGVPLPEGWPWQKRGKVLKEKCDDDKEMLQS